MHYIAELTKEGTRTIVSFPDCPGCNTFGRTLARARESAREALEGWLEAHLVAGDVPPRPVRKRASQNAESVQVAVPPILGVRLQLRWARQAAGLSQADLARRVGVTRQQIALLESPDANLTLRTLERVAAAMDLELDIQLSRKPHAA
jgi:predicted RNase H-like HicB family nuclease/DNA-binding XRE family transcriptional regulator